jgi:hypothetical protein
MDSKNGKELIMADINYLIAQGNLPRIQPMDIQDAEKNALLNQRTRMQNQFIPEEQNFTRQKMGQETTTFNQGQDDRMRELSRRSFKDNNEAFDTMIEQMPMVTWETYGASREWFIRHGMRADMLPEPAAIEKLAAQKGDTPDIAFEKFKEYTIPMAKRKREEIKLGVEEKKVGIAETQANRPIIQPGNSRLATATGQPIPGSEVPAADKEITELATFEAETGTSKKMRGTDVYREGIMKWRKEKKSREGGGEEGTEYKSFISDRMEAGKTKAEALAEWDERMTRRGATNIHIGNTVEGNPLILQGKGAPNIRELKAPAGGVAGKTLSEEFKKDSTSLGQAEDLVKQLETQWKNLGITDRVSAVSTFMAGKAGKNADAKVYADNYEAFLGNLSRSIAAERGVLTDQDINRIRGAIARIGLNPLNVDSKEEGQKKWKVLRDIIGAAKKRLDQKQRMTQANPAGDESGIKDYKAMSNDELLKRLEGK